LISTFRKVLVLAPHTDDGEFGCGGLIARMIEEGCDVYYAAFSLAEESVPEGLPKDILLTEVTKATEVLNIPSQNLLIYRYPVRKFSYHRQEILDDLVALNRSLAPDLVLMPSVYDLHQDHHVVAMEGLRAFKFTTILGYEMPWNNISFKTTCFVHLEERHVAKKIEALKCYRSQIGRKYSSELYIEGLARTRGVQVGTEYGEAFNIMRLIIR